MDNSRAVDAAVNTVAQIREAFGNQIEFGLDFSGHVSAPMAKVLIKELDRVAAVYLRSRCWRNKPNAAETGGTNASPLAAGEARVASHASILNASWRQAVWILQPDLSHAGGVYQILQNRRNGESL
ncbi:enolase C-terminal domain-like protein [Shigella flexneri]